VQTIHAKRSGRSGWIGSIAGAFALTALAAAGLAGAAIGQVVPEPGPSPADAWVNPATWATVQPIETDNVVFANVPLILNPSANPDPGTPRGIRAPLPDNAPPGTENLHLDVYRMPSPRPNPVVIQIHGGGWIRGDRPSSDNGFRALLAAGMSVVAVQYRNAKDAPAPAAVEDVRCAMSWVKQHAREFNFDLSRVVLFGGSAGGHLALMGAYAPASFNPPGCTDQPHVAAVLDFYGPTNLVEGVTEHGSSDFTHQWLDTQLPLPPATDATPGRRAPTRWPAPDAKTLALAKAMSPLTYIRPGGTPTFIVNGDSDHTVDPTQSAELKKALDAADVPNGQDIVPSGGHGNFSPAEDQKAMLLSLEFLKAQGILP
jgi:acetyl esterase/lipase